MDNTKHTVPCRDCGLCTLNCTMGLDIPFFMKAYNRYQQRAVFSEELYSTIAKNPKMCIQCAHCAEMCPQEIDIPGTIRFLSVL